MKFKAIITTREGQKIILDLSCREYNANKLNYVLSRTLDRSVYMDAAVVACENISFSSIVPQPPKEVKKISIEED